MTPYFSLVLTERPLFSLVCHRKTPTLGVVSAHPRHLCDPPSSANEQMRKDPLLTSLHFERRWRAFLKYILKGKTKPLGKLNDYFAKIEHRNGGSPHLHIFLWIEDAPAVHQSSIRNLITYMTVLKIWLTFGRHGREKFIKAWIIQNDTQSNVFLGNFAHTFWFWPLKASVMSFFFYRFLRFYDQIWPKIPVLEWHIFWQCNLGYEKNSSYVANYWYILTLNVNT